METEDTSVIPPSTPAAMLLLCPTSDPKHVYQTLQSFVDENPDPSLSSIQLIPLQPSILSHLKQWTQAIAVDIVQEWRLFPAEETALSTLFRDLELHLEEPVHSPLVDLLQRAGQEKALYQTLQDYLQELETEQLEQKLSGSSLRRWIEQKAADLKIWFYGGWVNASAEGSAPRSPVDGCLKQLQLYKPTLLAKKLHSLTTALVQIRRLGAQTALRQLNTVIETLQFISSNFSAHRQEHRQRAKSAQKAYYNLLSQIRDPKWGVGEGDAAWKSILRALNLVYTSNLEAAIFSLAEQLLEDLIQNTQQLMDSIAKTDLLLTDIQAHLAQHPPIPTIPSPVLRTLLLERISKMNVLRQMEEWVGSPIHQWGSLDTLNPEKFQEEFLKLLYPVCLSLYVDCYHAMHAEAQTIPPAS
jgi:hypothetical protein